MTKNNDIKTPQPPLGGAMRPIRLIGLIGLIRPVGLMRLISLMGLISLIGLVSCSRDHDDEGEEVKEVRQSAPMELMSFATIFMDEDPDSRNVARRTPAWVPDGYKLYSELKDADATLMTNENAAIGVFFTKDSPTTVEQRKFRYGSDEKWRMNEELEVGGDYFLYGYVPLDAATVTIAPDEVTGKYADGARLTFTGLSSVMNKDVCVLVGAKEGTSASSAVTYEEVTEVVVGTTTVTGYYTRSGAGTELDPYVYTEITAPNTKAAAETTYYRKDDIATGKFDVNINVGEDAHNYLFLLFDHIYSALSFRFKISSTYNQLRDIKLKKLELIAYSDVNFRHKMKKHQSATITLKAKTDGTSPMPSDITFTPDETSGDIGYVLIYENIENPYLLKTVDDEGMVGFVPRNANYFMLRSTYDVYDKMGNLVRKDCMAENRINLPYLFNQEQLDFGHRYIIRLFVEPTYLYQLSDPDLDNPVIRVVSD